MTRNIYTVAQSTETPFALAIWIAPLDFRLKSAKVHFVVTICCGSKKNPHEIKIVLFSQARNTCLFADNTFDEITLVHVFSFHRPHVGINAAVSFHLFLIFYLVKVRWMYCRCYYKPSMIKDNGKWEEPISFLIYVFGCIFWYRVSWIFFQNILRRKTFSISPIFIFLHRIERFQIYEVTLSQSLSCNLFSEIIFAEDYRSGKYYCLRYLGNGQ